MIASWLWLIAVATACFNIRTFLMFDIYSTPKKEQGDYITAPIVMLTNATKYY
tara:strand:- start:657 stop:815 length:159 start_codon:yes stop_codon:yes gene_type:complete